MFTITNTASAAIQRLVQKEIEAGNIGPHWCLYFSVVGGGCSGFQYEMRFEERCADRVDYNGIPVHIPEKVQPMVDGVTIDWKEDLMESGFNVTNANAQTTCGCGKSFK